MTTLLQAGRKLDAIRLYREQTGASLKDATDMIKDLERKLDLADQSEIEHSQDAATLLRAGRKLDAIRVYREQHGLSLKDATEAISDMEKNLAACGSNVQALNIRAVATPCHRAGVVWPRVEDATPPLWPTDPSIAQRQRPTDLGF